MDEITFVKWETTPKVEGPYHGVYQMGRGEAIKVGEVYVGITVLLSNALENMAETLRVGDSLVIEFLGQGKNVKNFRVYHKGVEVSTTVCKAIPLSQAIENARKRGVRK